MLHLLITNLHHEDLTGSSALILLGQAIIITTEKVKFTNKGEKMNFENSIVLNGKHFMIKKLLGKGKGGYSWLAENETGQFVIKQIHHEPCSYYQFGDKIRSEYDDYFRLQNAEIRIPKMIDIDFDRELILKEYIDGPTIVEMIKSNEICQDYYDQILTMSRQAKEAGLNIDYYPTNFIVQDHLLYYVDYECNNYMVEWDFDHWGQQFWTDSASFRKAFDSVSNDSHE